MKKILVIDDDKVVLTLAEKTLSAKYSVSTAVSGSQALELFSADMPDLVLSDLLMPEMSGYELQRAISEMSADRIPFVFMTSDESDESESKGFEQGAWDYIRKPVKADLLLKRIERIFINVDEEKKLRQAAATDTMTGLLNKTTSTETISSLCLEEDGALLMMDLDSFKMVNDIYGHEMGDRILISFAKLLRSVFRENDVLGRVGGDEFIAFCPRLHDDNTIASRAAALNEGLSAAAREHMGEDMDIPLGCSMGATYINSGVSDFKTQLSQADDALYEAKRNGKHCYKIFCNTTADQPEKKTGDLESLAILFSERDHGRGAWIVDESQFRTCYRFLERFISNYPWDIRFVVFKIGTETDENLAEETSAFCDMSYRILRSSDIILKYAPGKVTMLLMKVDDESSLVPIKRVANAWKNSEHSGISLEYRSRRLGRHNETRSLT